MTELNLTELDYQARETESTARGPVTVRYLGPDDVGKPWQVGWWVGTGGVSWVVFTPDCEAEARLYAAARNQLRPLLDLMGRMHEALREQAIMAHVAQDHCGTWGRCTDEACMVARSAVTDYRKAKGGR